MKGEKHDNKDEHKAHKMAEDKKPATRGYVKEVMSEHVKSMHKGHARHKEHR